MRRFALFTKSLTVRKVWSPGIIASAAATVGLICWPAIAAQTGPKIPLSVDSVTVNDQTGALPLTVPLTFDGGECTGSGTVTVSLVNGAIQMDANGSVSGTNCNNIFFLFGNASFNVPHIGERLTPVMWALSSESSTVTGDCSFIRAQGLVESSGLGGTPYTSALAGTGSLAPFTLTLNDPLSRVIGIAHYIPGDSIISETLFVSHQGFLCPTGGTFSETLVFSASLPPEPAMAAVPGLSGWLLVGILLGLGIKLLTRSRV